MLTCFLFIQSNDLESILSLRMDPHGKIDHPLQLRTVEEIRPLQENSKTMVVFPSSWCGLYQIELPLLPDRKARIAIPFALEDQIAQPVSQVHFAFDKAHYRNGSYSVVVIDKQIMANWMEKFTHLNLNYEQITIDWLALEPGEAVIDDETVLVNADAFQGAVSLDVWEHLDHPWSKELSWQLFSDKINMQDMPTVLNHAIPKTTWIAERLLKAKILNLCQGAFQHATSKTEVKRKFQLTGILAVTWLASFVAVHLGLYWMITTQSKKVDQQIAKSYHVFFPDAEKVLNPKLKIEQLLKQNQEGNNALLWSLMESWSLAVHVDAESMSKESPKSVMTMQNMQFRNQILTVMFRCNNFSDLEKIEAFLQQRHVKVNQVSAATENDLVTAKLELSL